MLRNWQYLDCCEQICFPLQYIYRKLLKYIIIIMVAAKSCWKLTSSKPELYLSQSSFRRVGSSAPWLLAITSSSGIQFKTISIINALESVYFRYYMLVMLYFVWYGEGDGQDLFNNSDRHHTYIYADP